MGYPFSSHEAEKLIESTLGGYRTLLGQTPGGAVYDSTDLKWSWTGYSHLNMVFGSHMEMAHVPDRIRQLKTYFTQRHIAYVNWLIGPSSQPSDLGALLVKEYGAHQIDGRASVQLTGMILDMEHLVAVDQQLEDVTIEEVRQSDTLHLWLDLAYDHPVRRKVMKQLIETFGFSSTPQIYAYLCHFRGEPVGTALIYENAQAIALRNVSVREAVRGQGIGHWISWSVLEASRNRHHRIAITDATEAGAGVYRKLGFKESCSLYEYAVRIQE